MSRLKRAIYMKTHNGARNVYLAQLGNLVWGTCFLFIIMIVLRLIYNRYGHLKISLFAVIPIKSEKVIATYEQ
ncbi:unnamed protein product [Leptosia nina]|uniref:Uncharacterized protein n=1 Tax=Leptosia nina TaxID=320188 RepID=A0AAV1IXF3_9NEOP